MLDPTIIKSLFLTNFFMRIEVSLLHFVMLPFINFPDDFPCPEYSSAKKLSLFFLANFKKVFGFFPSKSDIKPCKKTINEEFL
jgi:hypothetical protein